MTELHVLRVFTDEAGRHGNPLGVFLDGREIPAPRRQPIAAALRFSETVFVEGGTPTRIRLYTPAAELPFAGHAVLGTAWLLRLGHGHAEILRPPAGDVAVHAEGDLIWIRARPEWSPPWQLIQMDSADEVERATQAPSAHDAVQIWAFEDAAAGKVRARVFAPRFGVPEDEACGSASMLLAARLGRPLTIRHGTSSQIHARPGPDGTIDLGGRTTLAEIRNAAAFLEAAGRTLAAGDKERRRD